MDSVLGACIALTAFSIIISTNALLAARRAEKRSGEFLEWKAGLVSIQSNPAPKAGPFPNSIPCGTAVVPATVKINYGGITIDNSAANRELNDLYWRIKKLQDGSPLKGD